MLTPDPPCSAVCIGSNTAPAPAQSTLPPSATCNGRGWQPQSHATRPFECTRLCCPSGTSGSHGGFWLGLGGRHSSAPRRLKGGSPHHPLHTVAVVGTGLDRVYPHQNHALALEIAAHGLLISEYPLNTPPLTSNFPQRNRLIAGLSQGCLVVEAAARSGSLITAKQALDLGKEVFAIPGSIHTTVSKGCHDLIKQGAKLVDCAQDILEELKDLPAVGWHTASAPDLLNPPEGARTLFGK